MNNFVLAEVKSTTMRQQHSSASRLLLVVVSIHMEQTAYTDILKFFAHLYSLSNHYKVIMPEFLISVKRNIVIPSTSEGFPQCVQGRVHLIN